MAMTLEFEFFTGDYGQRLDLLEEALDRAEKAQGGDGGIPATMNETDPVEAIATDLTALRAEARAEARAAGKAGVLSAVGRAVWRELKAKHPARVPGEGVDPEDVKADRGPGINLDTALDDLVHASLTEPADKSCARDMRQQGEACSADNRCTRRQGFDEWADRLSEGEWRTLSLDSLSLALGTRSIPKDPSSPTTSDG